MFDHKSQSFLVEQLMGIQRQENPPQLICKPIFTFGEDQIRAVTDRSDFRQFWGYRGALNIEFGAVRQCSLPVNYSAKK